MVHGTTINPVARARSKHHSRIPIIFWSPFLWEVYCYSTFKLPQVFMLFSSYHCPCLLILKPSGYPLLAWHRRDLCSSSSPLQLIPLPTIQDCWTSHSSSWSLRTLYLSLCICCLCCLRCLFLLFLLANFSFWKTSPLLRRSPDPLKQEKSVSSVLW